MSTYAKGTSVSPIKTRAEIEETLGRFGASGFAFASTAERVRIEFLYKPKGKGSINEHGGPHGGPSLTLRIRFELTLPSSPPATARSRTREQVAKAVEQHHRELWRALLLLVKAKLAGVQAGVVSFETEFLPHIVVGEGTVGDAMVPQIVDAYEKGQVPKLLGPATGRA